LDHVELVDYLKEIQDLYPVSPAIKRTEEVVDQFRWQLQVLQDPNISDQAKIRLASRIRPVQHSLKKLKNSMPESKFLMFYKNVIEGKSMQSLALVYGCDPKTVKRAKNRAYKQLAVMLYSDQVITEMIIVGW